MSKIGMVIGLGGIGVEVVHRIRDILASSPSGKVPDSLRLLAFDVLRPNLATGRLGQPYYFLVRLPPGEKGQPTSRLEARQVLIQDLEKGGPSSLVLRGLSINIDALRRGGANTVDIFLVSSSFGATGSAWMLDMAYLCRYYSKGRMAIDVHALLITPDACQGTYQLNRSHHLNNIAVLKELESFQKERDWSAGISLFDDRYIAGMPGILNSPPFASVQVLDGFGLSGQPEISSIPAAADGILCQLDEQTGQILRQARANRPAGRSGQTANVFSTLGVLTVTRPTRLLVEAGIQRAILRLVDSLLPVGHDLASGRPVSLTTSAPPLGGAPSSDLAHWLGWKETSGVMEDVFTQGGLDSPQARQDWVNRLARRDTLEWKVTLFRVADIENTIPVSGASETTIPLIRCHFRAYLRALAAKTRALDGKPAGVLEHLTLLDQTLTDYIADLGRAEEVLRRQGNHSEAPAVRLKVEETRRDWESKRTSNWSRLFPQQVEEAQERHIQARQAQVTFQQREVLLGAVRKSASLMLTLTRKLITLYQFYTNVLALARDSLYNTTLDRLQRVKRELETEHSIRCQRVVIDETYEERQIYTVTYQQIELIFPAIAKVLERVEHSVDWLADSLQIFAPLRGLNITEGLLDLADVNREPEEIAGRLSRYLNRDLSEQMVTAHSGNTILNFINYLNPRPRQLGAEMVTRSAALAKTLISPSVQIAFLFTPDLDATEHIPFMHELVYELYQNFNEMYQIESGDPDRITLFRRFDELSLDNLETYQQSAPGNMDSSDLKPFVLWRL